MTASAMPHRYGAQFRTQFRARFRAPFLVTASLVGAVMLTGACGESTAPSPNAPVDSLLALPRALTATERAGIASGNQFALSLLKQVAPVTSKNVLLSPLSVWTALGMTMNGAAGTTEAEMQRTLGWTGRTRAESNVAYRDLSALLPSLDAAVKVKIGNAIWVRAPLVADTGFARDVRTYFSADVKSAASPQAMYDAVNAWGNQQTDGMVPKVLETPPPSDLLMLLANAVLFDGPWRHAFDAKNTAPARFRLESTGTDITVPTMQRMGGYRSYDESGFFAIELPYGNTAYSMLVMVPKSGTVNALVTRVDSAQLARITSSLREASSTSPLALPKFTVRGSLELSPSLRLMGMPRAFTDQAEFPRFLGIGAKLAFVQHAVTVEVNERGTRAAAVTAVGVVPVSAPVGHSVDRPFAFFIRERFAGTILFAGVVRDPRA